MPQKLVLDAQSVAGLILAVAGWLSANGPQIVPTLPLADQHFAGAIIAIAGAITVAFSDKLVKKGTP